MSQNDPEEMKMRVAKYLRRLMKHYGTTHEGMGSLLETSGSTLQGWMSATNMPGTLALSKIALLGGITITELVMEDDAPIGTKSNIVAMNNDLSPSGGAVANIGNLNLGSLNPWNPPIKKPKKDELSKDQIKGLQQLVDRIVEMEEVHKDRPRSYGAIWRALCRKMSVTHYWEIPSDRYNRAIRYLNRWLDRLSEIADETRKGK